MRVFGAFTLMLSVLAVTAIATDWPMHRELFAILVLAAGVSSILFLGLILIRGFKRTRQPPSGEGVSQE
jgi:hypothetical protein